MKIEQKYFVGVQDLGPDNQITNRALLDALSNTATVHATSVGQGIDDMYTQHLTWVAINWKVQILHRCGACQWITVRTWAQSYNRLKAIRNYEVLDEDGAVMAYASSVWTAIDPESGDILRLTPELMDGYQGEPDNVLFPDVKYVKNMPTDLIVARAVRRQVFRSMIDCNHHVHNTAYLDLARESLPEEEDMIPFNNLEVTYRREIKPEEELEIRCGELDGNWYVGIYSAEEQQLHSVLKMYRE